jgi:hypothetical protein
MGDELPVSSRHLLGLIALGKVKEEDVVGFYSHKAVSHHT